MKLTEAQLGLITAEMTHVLLCVLIVLVTALLFQGSELALVAQFAVVTVIALLKEYYWDPVHETNEPFVWQGAVDFVFYWAGEGAGFVLLLVLHNVMGLPL